MAERRPKALGKNAPPPAGRPKGVTEKRASSLPAAPTAKRRNSEAGEADPAPTAKRRNSEARAAEPAARNSEAGEAEPADKRRNSEADEAEWAELFDVESWQAGSADELMFRRPEKGGRHRTFLKGGRHRTIDGFYSWENFISPAVEAYWAHFRTLWRLLQLGEASLPMGGFASPAVEAYWVFNTLVVNRVF